MIPIYKEISNLINNEYTNGNFNLWFNKFIEIDNKNFKVKVDVAYVKNKYENLTKNTINLLNEKHEFQNQFCEVFSKCFKVLVYEATTKSPFITGVGASHPLEFNMILDHNIGIPYIPASSIKGIVRFAHTVSLIDEALKNNKIKNNEFNDEEDWTKIPEMFGKGGDEGNIGRIIFLDAYPYNIPNLKLEIMNPHYESYYLNKGNDAPADYHDPIPIKFLTVDVGTKFILRILINNNFLHLEEDVKNALKNSFEENGIGAKTAVGYGKFELKLIENNQNQKFKNINVGTKLNNCNLMTEAEKIVYNLQNTSDENYSMEIYQKLDSFNDEDKKIIANALKNFWIKIDKWNLKKVSDKQKKKIEKIKNILGEQ